MHCFGFYVGRAKVAIKMCSANCQPSAISCFPHSSFHLPRSRKTTGGKVDFQLVGISVVSLIFFLVFFAPKKLFLSHSQQHILLSPASSVVMF